MQNRHDLFKHIRAKKYNIACLQDVHIEKNLFPYIKAEWGYKVILSSHGINVNRGLMILINNNFACDIGRVLTDLNGNYVSLELKFQDKKILVVSLYGPNDDRPSFYRNLKQHIVGFEIDNVILCGDWNLVLNPESDTERYKHVNNPRARDEVLKFIDQENYVDVYRLLKEDQG